MGAHLPQYSLVYLNIHLENPISTKTNQRKLRKANSHERAPIAKTLFTDINAKM